MEKSLRSICLVILIAISAQATVTNSLERNQIWRVNAATDDQLQDLKDLENTKTVKMWRYPQKVNEPILIHVPSEHIKFSENYLSDANITYEVTVENLDDVINQQKFRSKRAITNLDEFDYTVYHRLEEIQEWMNLMTDRFPFVSQQQIGLSYEGRPLNMLKIQKPSSGAPKPIIWIDALIHSGEWVTSASLMFIWKEILNKPQYSWMIDSLDWYILPVLNVDGYVYSWTFNRFWRKTRSLTGTSFCLGVDGNRNWDSHWSEASSPSTCSLTYHAAFAGSESEIRHLTQFITEQKEGIKAFITLHSYSQLILYPYCYARNTYTPDHDEQHQLAVNMSKAMYEVHQTVYTPAQGAKGLNYLWSGCTIDWIYDKANITLTYTIELRDKGTYGFMLPPEQIVPTGEELLAGIEVLAAHVLNKH
ncbi:carboxypeptidase B-like [Clavelina lepadiformis]|uniref:carboxypeptidase B-like n=1 Tax=Clavelina lepadiformis TaxID=159417 RepID=UPI004042873F